MQRSPGALVIAALFLAGPATAQDLRDFCAQRPGKATLPLMGALTDPDGKGLAVSAEGFVTAPTATHGLGAGGWTGGLRLPISVPLGESSLGLAPEVDVLRDAGGGGAHLAWVGVGSL